MPKFSLLFTVLTFIIHCVYSTPTQARWATYADAPAEYEFYNSEIVIDKDGKAVEVVEKQVKILNELGRSTYGVERLLYNENQETIEIIEAKTIVDGKEYIVPKEMIEIKPLASDIQGFDQLFQILISFPHLNIGSRTYVKYKVTDRKVSLPNYFAFQFYYGFGAYWRKAHIKIKSELPLQMQENDPSGKLDIKQGKEGKYITLDVSTHKAAYDDLINEAPGNQVPDNKRTWFSISTYDTWDKFSKKAAIDYEKTINEKLPPLLESIRKIAAQSTNSIDQINTITSLLNEKIRYMGDWRTIKGKFSPRSLHAIAASGVGDCKDLSSSTVAILRSLGYKAQVALVMRKLAYLPPERILPSYLCFNHAIVKVTDKNDQVFWIDPTNFTSMANGIYPDISNRPALVLDLKNPSYEKIPEIDYKHSGVIIEDNIDIKENDILSRSGSITLIGEEAQPTTGAALSHSLRAIEEAVVKEVSGEASPAKKQVKLPLLNSRIVQDIIIQYSFEQHNTLLLTNAGTGILLYFNWSQPFIDTTDDQEGTIFLGLPTTFSKKTIIKDVDAEKAKSLTYKFTSPWVEAKRECRAIDNGIEVIDNICVLKSFLSAEEVKTKAYKDLKSLIKKYCTRLAIIISHDDKKNVNHPHSP